MVKYQTEIQNKRKR